MADIVSYKKDIDKLNGKSILGLELDYNEAAEYIRAEISNKRTSLIQQGNQESVKTKEDLRQEKEITRKWIVDFIINKNISVRNYRQEKIADFVEEMVAEYAGYSILEDAFNDDEITDIYVIDWETIFVEKKGENVRYWKKFRSPEHFKNVLDRFIRVNGKEINNGENKIVDFELYGDRGCATCNVVSPRDNSLTIRKHQEDHIILDQLLEWGLMTEDMKDWFGMIIDGEANLIYAGLTGSGKTTTIRALIDYYVTKNNKRMLVCEDTQELAPKNEHTLELVSVKSDKKENEVSLSKLILTALRLKPKYIVVGEVRGEEAMAAVEAMETGHSTLFTMHGGIPMNIINRLVNKYLMAMPELGSDVVERIIGSAVDYIAIQDNIPGIGRKISIIAEIGFDYEKSRVTITPIFEYDFVKREFVLKNRLDPEKCHKLLRRGIPLETIEKWQKTDDPEVEAKFIEDFNRSYQERKPELEKMYQERKAKRESKKKVVKSSVQEDRERAQETLRQVISNEKKKMEQVKRAIDIYNSKKE